MRATPAAFHALVGLTLAAVGIYAVLSYAVVRRTREIGIRVALGAGPRMVVQTILAEIGKPVLIGVAAGLTAGSYVARFVESLLFEITPGDVRGAGVAMAILLATAALAPAVPARRAARLDPIVALRCE